MSYYTNIRASSSEESLEEHYPPRSRVRRPPKGTANSNVNDRLFFWTCIATLCSTALSIFLFTTSRIRDSHHATKHTSSQKILRRPSTYINLDKVLANSNHTFPPLTNFPQMVYQISTSDSSRKMTEDHKSQRTAIGTVYPDLRHIHITKEISTIVQFRHIDYGMERCTLNHSVPPHSDSKPSVVEVWELDIAVEISRYIGDTWKTAAPRRTLITTMVFPPNGDTYSFHCPSNEFSTFELACPSRSNGCQVDFWQDQRAQPIAGIYLVQTQSTPVQHDPRPKT